LKPWVLAAPHAVLPIREFLASKRQFEDEGNMDDKLAQQLLDELLPSLEALDTQSAAVLQFLKSKKIASDEGLAPFLEKAANASSVRWRAARLRVEYLLSSAAKAQEPSEEKSSGTPQQNQQPKQNIAASGAGSQQQEKRAQNQNKGSANSDAERDNARSAEGKGTAKAQEASQAKSFGTPQQSQQPKQDIAASGIASQKPQKQTQHEDRGGVKSDAERDRAARPQDKRKDQVKNAKNARSEKPEGEDAA
jgi:hypothetical protein